jgi:hypothetical protein
MMITLLEAGNLRPASKRSKPPMSKKKRKLLNRRRKRWTWS